SVYGVNSVTGTIALNTSAAIGVSAGMLTQSGVISGPADLTKLGGGTLALTAANTYQGRTNVNNGVVTVSVNAFALGSIVAPTVVHTGATLQDITAGGIFSAETLILNGTGFAGANLAGAFVAAANATTLQGNIVLNAGATIGVNPGVTLNLPGIVSGAD